jgi:hypothetical protein
MALTACASAGAKPAPEARDPIVETQFRTRIVCPAELGLTVPAPVEPAADAEIRTNASGDAYLDAKDGREALLAQRLTDAQGQCPKAVP